MQRKLKISIKVITAILFGAIIFLPGIQDNLCIFKKQEFMNWENRYPANEPEFDIKKLDPFPAKFDTFYNDNFAFRNTFLDAYVNICYHIFNKSPFPERVIIGKNGQMFEGSKERKIYDGTYNYSDDTLNMIINELRARTIEYRKHGIKFYFTIAPMNYMIYPERVPPFVKKADSTFTERIITRLNRDTIIRFIDLHKHIRSKKDGPEQYFKVDNHWNTNGAFNAYQKIIEYLNKDFPVLKPLKYNDFMIGTKVRTGGNLAQMIGLEGACYEFDYIYSPYFTPCGTSADATGYTPVDNFPYESYENVYLCNDTLKPKVVFIRDSYMDRQIGFLKEHFNKSTYIFDAWNYMYNEEVVYSEKPDIVLLQIFEPHVVNILRKPSSVLPRE